MAPKAAAAGGSDRASRRSLPLVVLILTALFLAAATASMCLGRYALSPAEVGAALLAAINPAWGEGVSESASNVVLKLRLPRVLAAFLVGAALALAGTTYQGIFKNPLVSPDLLGVSSGACVGAALSILLGLGLAFQQGFAFLGGIVAVALTTLIPRLMRRDSTIMLVLSGVIVGGFLSSVIGLLKYVANPETQLPDIVYWSLGSLAKVNMQSILSMAPPMLLTAAVLLLMSWRINVLSLNDQDARMLGVNLRRERGVAIVCSTLLTACAVCMSGTIGWIGLVMPHIARRLVGIDNVGALPVAALSSATFLLVIDTIARTVTGAELPLGILTGFIGAPFFAMVLVRERMDV